MGLGMGYYRSPPIGLALCYYKLSGPRRHRWCSDAFRQDVSAFLLSGCSYRPGYTFLI